MILYYMRLCWFTVIDAAPGTPDRGINSRRQHTAHRKHKTEKQTGHNKHTHTHKHKHKRTLVSTSSNRSLYSRDWDKLPPMSSSALTMFLSLLDAPPTSSLWYSALPSRCLTDAQPRSSASPETTLLMSRRLANNW
jgi:hypothetical protein